MSEKIKVKELNENFICILCNGYLIRPVAITECLHYFCRSCIVQYLQAASQYKCPYCDEPIHETNPWELLREDKKLEYIISQLIPGLTEREKKRRQLFYSENGTDDPDEQSTTTKSNISNVKTEQEGTGKSASTTGHHEAARPVLDSSQIGLHLNYIEPALISNFSSGKEKMNYHGLEKPYLRTSSNITVAHLKKFLQKKLKQSSIDVDILCNGELMGKHHTLEFIYMTRWRYKEGVLKLDYRPKVELT